MDNPVHLPLDQLPTGGVPVKTKTFAHITAKLSPWPQNAKDIVGQSGQQEYLPIQPSARLWLPKLGYGNDVRFAKIFRDTWRQIPLRARRMMVRHWREDSRHFPIQGWFSPTIALVDDWELSDRVWRQPRDQAMCGRNGHSLYFWAPIVDAMPDVHVADLIAHELAHVIQYAIGEGPTYDPGKDPNERVNPWFDPIELYADELALSWGFDPDGIDDWCRKNWTRTD